MSTYFMFGKYSSAVAKLTGIAFTTSEAIAVGDFAAGL